MFPHTPKWSKKAILVFLVIVIIIYWFLVKSSDYVLPMILNNEEGSGIKGPFAIKFGSSTQQPFNQTCKLPKINPWDPAIKHLFNPNYQPLANCWPSFKERSFLSSFGHLFIDEIEEKERCWFRCKEALSDHELHLDEWTQIDGDKGVQPNCDLIDVKCEIDTHLTYKFQHVQVVEKTSKTNFKNGSFNVYIMLLDAVSMSQFHRAFPLTHKFLEQEMGAIEFKYLNKVGENSRPNAYAFLMGEQPESTNFADSESASQHANELCNQPVDNKTILSDFKRQGYRVFHFEDYAQTVFYWPDCKSFTNNEFDHTLRPFIIPIDGDKNMQDDELAYNLLKNSCREPHEYLLKAVEQYWDKYKDQPKFSLTWMTYLNHNEMDLLFHVDRQFRDFFDQNREKLSNSFLFLMGDHGNNLDDIRQTPIGQQESSNPFLMFKLPKQLQSNEKLMQQVHENSRQLISHHDLYATFVDIAENSHQWSTKYSINHQFEHPTKKLIGSSLMHSLKEPRNCHALQIPAQYCLCEHEYRLITDPALSIPIANAVVQKMNDDLLDLDYTSKCAELFVDEVATKKMKIQLYNVSKDMKLLRVELRVKPSGGLYDIYAEYQNGEIRLLTNRFARLDSYAEQSKCVPPSMFIRNYCFCK